MRLAEGVRNAPVRGGGELHGNAERDPTKVVVISLGLYDLNNIDSYINTYNDLINKYPNQIFISSINPVDETKTTAYSNIDIENFNKKLSDNFKSNYIDTYSTTTTLNSVDGITYDNTTYESIHKNLVSDLKNSEKISCSTGLSNIVYYNQNDYTESYGYGTTIKSDGCGPVAMAMIISTLTDKKVTPIETAKYSLDNGYRTNGGTSTDFITAIATEHGIKTETLTLDQESITNALSQSKPILMIVGPGNFTSRNHYIILTGISEDGKVTIADPLSLEKSNQLWEMSTIINEGTGSLWAFSI